MADADSSVPRSVPLVRAACIVVVLAGFYLAKPILMPIILAAFLAILCYKPMQWLHQRRVPTWLALVIVMLVAVSILGAFGLIVGNAVAEFVAVAPDYAESLKEQTTGIYDWLDAHGVDVEVLQEGASGDTRKLVALLTGAMGDILSLLSDFVLILLVTAFMLAEGAAMPAKFRRAVGRPDADLSAATQIMDQVHSYVSIKTWVSAVTGLLFGLATWIIGVDFPVLWGVLAFALNFVPNIGSVLALIPPMLMALLQLGPAQAGMVVVANILVNQVIGNIVEPKVMGSRLGLSPLVVILSLLFWSFLWGPIGMVLSVPLTMVVKIVMEHSRDWKTVAVLLGPAEGPAGASRPSTSWV
jgi:AI-2 transport protein TqsA